MTFNRSLLTLLFALSLSVFSIGCGESEAPVDPDAPAPDVIPEEDFEGEAAQSNTEE